ncbi:MAG: DEAD/DEAH box helicase [Spirochaetales bacterium]|nr:DEAD/DEAH box helicase [Spirochaetales bacterium]
MKNLLGNKTSFKQEFAIPIEKFNNQNRLEAFKKITAPFILRRMKTDKTIINDLPDKISMDQWVSLSKEQTALYQDLVSTVEALDDNEDGINRKGLIFKLILGFKQICNHPSLYLKKETANPELSGKSVLLLELLEKITERKEKVLIFTQFKEMGTILEKMINDHFSAETLFFHGSLSQKKRNTIIDNFQNTQEHPFLIISLKAGGTGLNLTAANNVIHYDLWWNPAVENQATDRAFRIGQKKNVNVYRFITKGTFEERINDMIISKKELSDMTVNQGEKWITEMSNKELKELLTLSKQP